MHIWKSITIVAFAVTSLTACATEPDSSPGQHLLQVARDADQRVDQLTAAGAVISPATVQGLLGDVDLASQEYADSTATWATQGDSIATLTRELNFAVTASGHLNALMQKLDIKIPVIGADGAYDVESSDYCPTPTPTDSPTPTPTSSPTPTPTGSPTPTPTGSPTPTPTGSPYYGQSQPATSPYFARVACRTACATAQVAAQALCASLIVPPLTPLSPGIIACMAAAVAGGAICQEGCGHICNF